MRCTMKGSSSEIRARDQQTSIMWVDLVVRKECCYEDLRHIRWLRVRLLIEKGNLPITKTEENHDG